MMICHKCSKENLGDILFCTYCGTQIATLDPRPNFLRRSLKYVGPKTLTRSRGNRWVAGVCGGLSEYYGMNVTILRLLFIFFGFLGLTGVFAYLLIAIFIPESSLDPWSE